MRPDAGMADATGTQAPCLHECEARKALRRLRPSKFDAAERRGVAGGTPAFQSVDERRRPFASGMAASSQGYRASASAVGLFAGGFAVGTGVLAGVLAGVFAGVAVGFTSGVVGAVPVLAFAAGCFGVGVGLGVVIGTGHRISPLGCTEHPAGMSCMKGLWPGGIFIVLPPGPIYV